MRISVILPAKNEVEGLRRTLPALRTVLPTAEVIVVDDGSTDATAAVAAELGARVVSAPYSMGNGAAIKRGTRVATGDILVFMDADGQHDPAHIQRLLERLEAGFDMAVGARGAGGQANAGRGAANALYNRLASWMTGHKVADLTSGFRYYNARACRLLAREEATLLDYQDIGVLLLLRRANLRIAEVSVAMNPRKSGASRVFSSWWIVGRYMVETTLLSLARWNQPRR